MSDRAFDGNSQLALKIDEICDRFEQQLREGDSPKIESSMVQFVRWLETQSASVQGTQRYQSVSELVENLISLEVEYRRREGKPATQDDYRRRFYSFAAAVDKAFTSLPAAEPTTDGSGQPPTIDPDPTQLETPSRPPAARFVCPDCSLELQPDPVGDNTSCPLCERDLIEASGAAQSTVAAADHPTDSLPARFEFRERLGEGAFGVVCRAWDRTLHRSVAVKSPKSTAVRQDLFLREARAASRLQHANIVRIFDVIEHESRVFIVSDLIEGRSMRHALRTEQFDRAEACRLIASIARAIEYSHTKGIVHRDLKPGNIILDRDGQPHILDFGLSQSLRHDEDSIAASGKAFGTPAYMPPEQVEGNLSNLGPRCDIYSLGVIFYQMLTHQLPYSGSSAKILGEIVTRDPTPPRDKDPSIPRALSAICLKAMARDPRGRYQTAALLADDLEDFLNGRKVAAYPHWEVRRLAGWFRRHRLAIAVAAGILGVGLAIWMWAVGNPRTPAPFQQTVVVATSPAEAQLLWQPIDPKTGEPVSETLYRSRGGEQLRLPPGRYKVTATTDRGDYFEVQRYIPQADEAPLMEYLGIRLPHRWFRVEQGMLALSPIRIIPRENLQRDLVSVAGGEVRIPLSWSESAMFGSESRTVGDFLIDRREATLGDLRTVLPGITGLPDEPDSVPAFEVHYDIALAYAERVGMNLPTYWEFVWAASNRGTTRYSWGSEQPEITLEAVAADQNLLSDVTPGADPIYDLMLGRAEWTETTLPEIRAPLAGPETPPVVLVPADWDSHMVYGVLQVLDSQDLARQAIPSAFEPGEFNAVTRPGENTGFRCIRRLKR